MTESSLTPNPNSADWVASRGEKWATQLAGMEATFTPVDGPLIRALQLDAPCRIADLGCGGGGTTFAVLRQAPAGSAVHGFDISPALIKLAGERRAPDQHGIAFDVANIATETPASGPYDRLVSRFSLMFFEDPPSALANLGRWLAPGGRFAFAVWGPPA